MGHVLTIESDEAFALATQLAALTGESLEAAVSAALRVQLDHERSRRAYIERAMRAIDAFHATLTGPLPSSDHSFLYDDKTGLPI